MIRGNRPADGGREAWSVYRAVADGGASDAADGDETPAVQAQTGSSGGWEAWSVYRAVVAGGSASDAVDSREAPAAQEQKGMSGSWEPSGRYGGLLWGKAADNGLWSWNGGWGAAHELTYFAW